MKVVSKAIHSLCNVCGMIGGIATVVLLVVMVADVVMRRFFGRPIVGATEVAQLTMVFIFIAVPLSTLENRHVRVDTFMNILPKKTRAVIDVGIYLISGLFCFIMAWRAYEMSFFSRKLNVTYSLLKIPEYPMLWVLSVCFILVCLAIVGLIIKTVKEVTDK